MSNVLQTRTRMIYPQFWACSRRLCLLSIIILYRVMINSPGTAAPTKCKLTAKPKAEFEVVIARFFNYMNRPFSRTSPRANVTVMAEKFRRMPCGYFISEWHKLKPSRPRRVIGGRVISFEYPWTVVLINQYGIAQCTGTLISHDWVLTAGHCVENIKIARIHVLRINDFVAVRESVTHPEFYHITPYADIALLKLERSVCLTDQVRPACLPLVDTDYTDRSSKCSVTGYGIQDPKRIYGQGSAPIFMKELSVNVIADSVCMYYQRIIYATFKSISPSLSVYCVFPNKSSEGICSGDSGGPLNCKVRDKYFVAGIASTAQDNCLSDKEPQIFVCTHCFIDWILSNVDFEKPNSPVCK